MAVRLSNLRAGRLLLPRKIFRYSFLLKAESSPCRKAAGTNMLSTKNTEEKVICVLSINGSKNNKVVQFVVSYIVLKMFLDVKEFCSNKTQSRIVLGEDYLAVKSSPHGCWGRLPIDAARRIIFSVVQSGSLVFVGTCFLILSPNIRKLMLWAWFMGQYFTDTIV
jgi:hypothetical protein